MKNKITTYLLLLAICYLEYRLIGMLHSGNIQDQLTIVTSPLDGNAWWRAFQNRLLSGALVSVVGLNLFIALSIAVKNFLFFKLTRDLSLTFGFVLLFCLFQDSRWLLAWDMIDTIIIILMLIGYKNSYSDRYYLFLFSIAIFNRESALFIPLFVIIKNLYLKKSILLPVLMIIFGVVVTLLLRDAFLISTQSYIGMDMANKTLGNHYYLPDNIGSFFREWMPRDKQISLLPGIIFTTIIYSFSYNKVLSLWMLVVFLITMVVGVIHETRVWLLVTPVLIWIFNREANR